MADSVGSCIARCSSKKFGIPVEDCTVICNKFVACNDTSCSNEIVTETIGACIKACPSNWKDFSSDGCNSYCNKAPLCITEECVTNAYNEAAMLSATAKSNTSSNTTMNIEFVFFFAMISIYFINFKRNH